MKRRSFLKSIVAALIVPCMPQIGEAKIEETREVWDGYTTGRTTLWNKPLTMKDLESCFKSVMDACPYPTPQWTIVMRPELRAELSEMGWVS